MTVEDLIEKLKRFDKHLVVTINDSTWGTLFAKHVEEVFAVVAADDPNKEDHPPQWQVRIV